MKVVARSDAGRIRKTNEDAVYADADLALLIVADGMGGHSSGEVASALAVETIASSMRAGLNGGTRLSEQAPADVQRLLCESVARAHDAIRARASTEPALAGMGTTVVVGFCPGPYIHIAHVGDSRAYLFTDGRLDRLTEDHTLVGRMVSSGEITARQARKHRLRNIVTRSIGSDNPATPDVATVAWNTGDTLLLCSDGLTSQVEEKRIQRLIPSRVDGLERSCQRLIASANAAGGSDNVTVILARRN